jgi:hypothetical protein
MRCHAALDRPQSGWNFDSNRSAEQRRSVARDGQLDLVHGGILVT